MNISNPLKLSIVFLNYNRVEDTRTTVMHLKKLIKGRNDIEVIAVDNASHDGTDIFLQSQSDWLMSIVKEENIGVAALNDGFKKASADYIFVLDDDSHPCNAETLETIIHLLDENQDIGAVACRIEFPDGRPNWTWHLPRDMDVPGSSMAFVGCGFAVRKDLFKRAGWYDDRFFLYQNETELAIRILNLGYQIYYEPLCRVVHRESPAGRNRWRQVYYPTRNTIWILRKYFPFPDLIYLIFTRLCIGLFRAVQFRHFSWYIKAVRDGFKEPVKPVHLSPAVLDKLDMLWQQNSLLHHFVFILKKK